MSDVKVEIAITISEDMDEGVTLVETVIVDGERVKSKTTRIPEDQIVPFMALVAGAVGVARGEATVEARSITMPSAVSDALDEFFADADADKPDPYDGVIRA